MPAQTIDVLMITHNRPEYTRMSLQRLLASCDENMRVWVWQNGEHEATRSVIRAFADHPRLHRIHMNPTNEKLIAPTNWIFEQGTGEFVAKVDDDCLVTDGWATELRETLEGDERMGVAACWHFRLEDFDERLASPKIVTLGNGRRIMRNRWVQGSGIMLKRECIRREGLLPPEFKGFTPYCTRLDRRGWMLGWVLPLVPIDHMDDPRSVHSRFKTEEDFEHNPPLGAAFGDVRSLAEWKERVRWLAREVQEAPLHEGRLGGLHRLRGRVLRRLRTLFGIDPPWRRAARRRG